MSVKTLTNSKVKFIIDRKGKRTHIIIPVKEYEDLLEDLYDNAIADAREGEGTISFDELKKLLYENGKVPD